MSEFQVTARRRVMIAGQPFDMTMRITLDSDIAADVLAKRLAGNRRRRAIVCYGALKADVTELQAVIP
jgi:hypothetical protein